MDIEEKMEWAYRASYNHGFPFKDPHGQWREVGFNQQQIDSVAEKPAEPVRRRPVAAGGSNGWWAAGGGYDSRDSARVGRPDLWRR